MAIPTSTTARFIILALINYQTCMVLSKDYGRTYISPLNDSTYGWEVNPNTAQDDNKPGLPTKTTTSTTTTTPKSTTPTTTTTLTTTTASSRNPSTVSAPSATTGNTQPRSVGVCWGFGFELVAMEKKPNNTTISPFALSAADSLLRCAWRCSRNFTCVSFSFDMSSKICSLYALVNNVVDLIASPNEAYYRVKL